MGRSYRGIYGNNEYSGKEIYMNIGKASNRYWQTYRRKNYQIIGSELFIPMPTTSIRGCWQSEHFLLKKDGYIFKSMGYYKDILKYDYNDHILKFGMYKNKTLQYILNNDKSYLEWLHKNQNTMNSLTDIDKNYINQILTYLH